MNYISELVQGIKNFIDFLISNLNTDRSYSELLLAIGESRGGNLPSGGIFWCDFIDEFNLPDEDLIQIFGHTSRFIDKKQGGIESITDPLNINRMGICIDCLNSGPKHEVLVRKNGVFYVYNLDTNKYEVF